MLRFILLTAVLTGLITATVVIGANHGTFLIPSFFKEIVIFLSLSTVGLYWFSTQRMGNGSTDFIKIYLGATVLRILFFGAFIFIVIQLDASGAVGNTILFLFSYTIFTVLEVAVLFLRINAQKSLKSGQKDL